MRLGDLSEHPRDDVHHVRVALDVHEPLDPDRARRAHAGEIVAGKVDQHHVLGPLLVGRHQLGLHGVILGSVAAAGPGAGDRPQLAFPVCPQPHVGLGRGADQLEGAEVQQEHVRRRIHRPQRPVERKGGCLGGTVHALAGQDLERVAGGDVLLGSLHDLEVAVVGNLGSGLAGDHRLGCFHRLGGAQRGHDPFHRLGFTGNGDHPADVIECHHRVGQHEPGAGNVGIVGVGRGQLDRLQLRDPVVADVSDRSPNERREARGCSGTGGRERGRLIERVHRGETGA